jgi:rhodanese-related sulfurtransferase
MDFFSKLFSSPVENINPPEAYKRLETKPKPFILDVRQPEEFRSGHIPGARLIPLGELARRVGDLPKTQEIICVCHSGSRSVQATQKLAEAGYKVVNLRGGMAAWLRLGLPVTKGK